MTKKRFKFADGYSLRYNCIIDNLKGEDRDIHNVLKTDEVLNMLNELHEENEQLKSDNFNLNKTVEYLSDTVKEQCNKIAWADECGVRWGKEYHEWIGDME